MFRRLVRAAVRRAKRILDRAGEYPDPAKALEILRGDDPRVGLIVSNIFDEPMEIGDTHIPPNSSVELLDGVIYSLPDGVKLGHVKE